MLSQLQNAFLKAKALNTMIKYHGLLPTEEAHHSFHETKGASGYAQRIHPKLIEKIYDFVVEGITDTQEVKRALKHHTLHLLCPEEKPDLVDRSYYPTTEVSEIMFTRPKRHANSPCLTKKIFSSRYSSGKPSHHSLGSTSAHTELWRRKRAMMMKRSVHKHFCTFTKSLGNKSFRENMGTPSL